MSGLAFFATFLLLALVDFLVPFYLLDDLARFTGSYLFWCTLALVVIVVGSLYIKNTWGKGR
ncbi:hypothetical protein KGY71_08235 [Candidatus Bipolaricaulota bacterium]|nr:hypothetical protein [Candidatus Bipolaricaulota bacterium]